MLRVIHRLLRQNKWITIISVAVLATGMGLCFGVFGLFAILVSPLQPGIVDSSFITLGLSQAQGSLAPMRWRDFETIRAAAGDALWVAGLSNPIEVDVGVHGFATKLRVEIVSADYFTALGIHLLAGRSFQRNEEGPADRVAVISGDLARKSFGSSKAALGELIIVENTPFRVVGIVAAPFQGAMMPGTSVWLPPNAVIPAFVRLPQGYNGPLTTLYRSSDLWSRIAVFYAVVRSRNANSERELGTRIVVMSDRLMEMKLQSIKGIEIDPMHRAQLIAWTKLALTLSIALFLVAALNFGAFLIAQIPRRGREIQIRRILGAKFYHLCMEILRGPALLLVISAVFGIGLAALFHHVLSKLLASSEAVFRAQPIHWTEFAFFIILTFAGLLVIGGLPMIELSRMKDTILDHGRITSSKRARGLLLGVIGFQGVISLLSVLSALFLVKSLRNWKELDQGFQPSAVVVARLGPKPGGSVTVTVNSSGDFELATYTNLALRKIRSLPEVQAAAVADAVPLARRPIFTRLTKSDGTAIKIEYNAVTQNYFQTVGIKMIHGRTFSSSSMTGEPDEAIVNVALAKSLWQDGQALDRVIRVPISPEADLEQGDGIPSVSVRIVGIADDAHYDGPTRSVTPLLYLRLAGSYMNQIPMFVVRGQLAPNNLELILKDTFGDAISGLVIQDSFSLKMLVDHSYNLDFLRAATAVVAAFMLLLLSLIGAYGITGFRIITRERELAIRICLGANLRVIMTLILQEVMAVAVASAVATVFAWIYLDGVLTQYIYGVGLWYMPIWGVGVAIWLCTLILACCVPGIRFLKLRPADLLRSE